MKALALRLPKQVEADPRGPVLQRFLNAHTRPLWAGSDIEVPVARLSPELETALRSARSAGQVVRGLEDARRMLAAEERGLGLAARHAVPSQAMRISRMLVLAQDGAERFYRQVEAMLRRHGPRVLAVRLETDADTLGGRLFGPGRPARLLMLNRKESVAAVLLAMAGQGENL